MMDEPKAAPCRDSIALIVAGLAPLGLAWLGFVHLANDADREQSPLAVVYSLGKIAQFAFPAVYVWLFERRRLTIPLAARGLGVALAFAGLVNVGMAGLYLGLLQRASWIAETPAKIFGKLEEFGLATPAGYLGIGLFLCVVHSLLEEYYWRWFVFGWLRRLVPVDWAMILASVGFMLHHVVILAVYLPGQFWTLAVPLSLAVAVGGYAWAWMYQRSGSLLGPWISHMLVDAGILLIGYEMLRGML